MNKTIYKDMLFITVLFVFGVELSTSQTIYDPSVTTTLLGCECKTSCSSSLAFDCYAQPSCIVKNSHCTRGDASYSYTKMGYADYCVYPEYTPYEKLTAAQKQVGAEPHVPNGVVHAAGACAALRISCCTCPGLSALRVRSAYSQRTVSVR